MKLKRYLIYASILVLFLTACSGNAIEKPIEPLFVESVIQVPIEIKGENGVIDPVNTAYGEMLYTFYAENKDNILYYYLLEYNIETGETQKQEIGFHQLSLSGNYFVCDFFVVDKEEYAFYIIEYPENLSAGEIQPIHNYIVHMNAEGEVLYKTDLNSVLKEKQLIQSGYLISGECITDKDGYCYIRGGEEGNTLIIVNKEGELVCSLEGENQFGPIDYPIKDEQGELLFSAVSYNAGKSTAYVLALDKDKDRLEKQYEFEEAVDVLLGIRGNTLYYRSLDNQIVQRNVISGESNPVFSLSENNIQYQDKVQMIFSKEDHPVLRVNNRDSDFLFTLTTEAVKHTDEIRIAYFSSWPDMEWEDKVYTAIQAAATITSRENANASLVVEKAEDDQDAFFQRIMTELTTGGGPQMLYVSREDALLLYEKGMLEDLSGLLLEDTKDKLLPAALEMASQENVIFGIPLEFYGNTWFTATQTWDKSTWSLDDILKLTEETKDLKAIATGESPYGLFYSLCGQDWYHSPYVDWTAGECNFMQESFYSLIELTKKYGNITCSNEEEELELIKSGRILAVKSGFYPPTIPNSLDCFKKLEGIAHPVGYPTESGNGNYLYSEGVLVVTKGLADYHLVSQFLQQLFSFDIQKNLDGLSVIRMDQQIKRDGKDKASLETSYGFVELDVKADGSTFVEDYYNLLMNCVPEPLSNTVIDSIVSEELDAFYHGDRDATATADIIQRRVQLYLDEQK